MELPRVSWLSTQVIQESLGLTTPVPDLAVIRPPACSEAIRHRTPRRNPSSTRSSRPQRFDGRAIASLGHILHLAKRKHPRVIEMGRPPVRTRLPRSQSTGSECPSRCRHSSATTRRCYHRRGTNGPNLRRGRRTKEEPRSSKVRKGPQTMLLLWPGRSLVDCLS